MRLIAILLCSLSACAAAKPKTDSVAHVKPSPPPKKPEFIDSADAEAAVTAHAELIRAESLWILAKAKFLSKYGIDIDPEAGEGWDVTNDGKLKARRNTPAK